ncbi:AAA family ATPase [Adhaeribacter soli]|uniref:ATP-binding protein n=1 Tax=Adhaeribacter soli TaxID=2607655 RepID=A0A5N1J286_9BACT|nr:AAA family ATPase [Adhaeribacter soli]KAA9340616.1 ATP-binding protein [Adhaeribacter soli]
MEAIIFCGIQATGKSTFYKERFFRTHVRISMDLLNTRNKEARFLDLCLKLQQRFVIDNTNPTIAERKRYIEAARNRKFKVIGFYFKSKVEDAIRRNAVRQGKEFVPEIGIRGTVKKLEAPTFAEGFDLLFEVALSDGDFKVTEVVNPLN